MLKHRYCYITYVFQSLLQISFRKLLKVSLYSISTNLEATNANQTICYQFNYARDTRIAHCFPSCSSDPYKQRRRKNNNKHAAVVLLKILNNGGLHIR